MCVSVLVAKLLLNHCVMRFFRFAIQLKKKSWYLLIIYNSHQFILLDCHLTVLVYGDIFCNLLLMWSDCYFSVIIICLVTPGLKHLEGYCCLPLLGLVVLILMAGLT
jgi:hypothetical protein